MQRLQYISQGETSSLQLQAIQKALDGGCSWIQLRFKESDYRTLAMLGEKVKAITDSYKAVLIINDHPELAIGLDAHGVHLGLDDMPVEEARTLLGMDKIIGGTANTLQQVRKRIQEGCDYIGLGPLRFTPTKKKLSPVLGYSGYKEISKGLVDINKRVSVFAIGGIVLHDIKPLMATGIYGICLSGLITTSPDSRKLISELNERLYAKPDHTY